ncbi:MAG: carbon-nitrogen hydrolase family protein [Pseudomonadota bacterium]
MSSLKRIAVHQMTSGVSPQQNVSDMIEAMAASAKSGAVMYFAPEMSIIIDRDRIRARPHMAFESQLSALTALSAAALEHRMWVHLGSIPVLHENGQKLANRTIIIGADGLIKARYDKIHLFDVNLDTGEAWRESSAYVGGDRPVVAKTPLGLMGLAICYDMRFPDLFSAYAKSGADILTLPSAFTVPTGEAHWHTILRARAIESETFVIAAAQCGLHEDGRATYGHSLVVDPWGTVILDMGVAPGLAFVDLDLTRIDDVRKQIPVNMNRRVISAPFIAG